VGNRHLDANPEEVYQSVLKTFEAGAEGFVVSREIRREAGPEPQSGWPRNPRIGEKQ